ALARTVGFENTNREVTARLAREGDVIPARAADRGRVMALAKADGLRQPTVCRHHIDLLAAATVAFEADARTVRRVAGRRIDRRGIGETRGLLRTQVHHKQVGVAALLQAHDHPLPVGREPRSKGHAREIADDLALSGFDVEQINARITLAVRHIRDLLRRRIETRRENQIVAAREIAHGRAILIHNGYTPQAAVP